MELATQYAGELRHVVVPVEGAFSHLESAVAVAWGLSVGTFTLRGVEGGLKGTAKDTPLAGVLGSIAEMVVVECDVVAVATARILKTYDVQTAAQALHVVAAVSTDPISTVHDINTLLETTSVDVSDSGGATALLFACRFGNLPAVDALLAADASVSHEDRAGRTALHCAAEKGDMRVVEALLGAGGVPEGVWRVAMLAGHVGVAWRLLAAVVSQPGCTWLGALWLCVQCLVWQFIAGPLRATVYSAASGVSGIEPMR